jgi:hypothetical protein
VLRWGIFQLLVAAVQVVVVAEVEEHHHLVQVAATAAFPTRPILPHVEAPPQPGEQIPLMPMQALVFGTLAILTWTPSPTPKTIRATNKANSSSKDPFPAPPLHQPWKHRPFTTPMHPAAVQVVF